MTDRHAGYIVTLAKNLRDDDSADIITAIRLLSGVLDVQPVAASTDIHIAETRARIDIEQRVLTALRRKEDSRG